MGTTKTKKGQKIATKLSGRYADAAGSEAMFKVVVLELLVDLVHQGTAIRRRLGSIERAILAIQVPSGAVMPDEIRDTIETRLVSAGLKVDQAKEILSDLTAPPPPPPPAT